MNAPVATRSALEALIDELRARESPDRTSRRVVAVRAKPQWPTDEQLVIGADSARVVPCRSSLEARVAISERDDPLEWLVLLTEAEGRELGAEVMARLPRRRIEILDLWHAAALAFGATKADPLLRSIPELAELLLAIRPIGGFPRVSGAVLTRDVAWAAACDTRAEGECSRNSTG